MEPEDIKNQIFLDQEGYRNSAGCSATTSHNVICEPVPLESKSFTVASSAVQPQLKWKNAFGFVYQVRKKLSNQPHVYNDFIDIMRKVHNRSIETAEVVAVISDLFKKHPDLIRGFNAFLPDKHKIDVKLQLRVAVSGIPSPDSPSGDPNEREELPITTRIIRFTLNVRKRFEDDEKRPEKYKRFVEVLYLYKALSQQLQGLRRCKKKLKEEDVYAEVRKLFENNEDLLLEFSEYLPYNKRLSEIYKDSYKYYNDDGPYNCSCCSDVSSSGQVDVGKELIDEKLDGNRSHDEVTSSDDPGRFHSDLPPPFRSQDMKDLKKYDVSSTRINIKRELLDSVEFNDPNFSSLTRDVLEGPSCMPDREYILKYFKSELPDDMCDAFRDDPDNMEANKKQLKNRVINHSSYDKSRKSFENSLITIKKEKFNSYDPNDRFIDSFSAENETGFKRNVDEAQRCRTPRKPLTPFKVPLPPANRTLQDPRSKRTVEEEYTILPDDESSAVGQTASRSPSPQDETETSVITRLAKRAALDNLEHETESADASSSPRRGASHTSTNSPPPPPKSSSDRRLRNLRKRLRRLANL